MKSDFAAARQHLEKAYGHIEGSDETSRKAREALDWLIEAILSAEHAAPRGEIIPFPTGRNHRKAAGARRRQPD